MSKNCTCTPSPEGWHQNHCDMVGANEYERGIAEGERRERAAVVAWLREQVSTMRGVMFAWRDGLEWAAARFEAGEHKETSQKANEDRCPYPGCTGVKDHVECPTCGEEHCLRCFE